MLETWYVFVTEEMLNNRENVNFRYYEMGWACGAYG